ncbi:MAG: glycoside hydrolase family 65 [bacterium]|nr:glycoside hydrolase family 65 [bacterium]
MLALAFLFARAAWVEPIDRQALTSRHDPALTEFDAFAPLSVGNGGFAFTVGVTGLQTLSKEYAGAIPLGTLSQWGWHTIPAPEPYRLNDAVQWFDAGGDKKPYVSETKSAAARWLRANPHRLHLGRIGFVRSGGSPAAIQRGDVQSIHQKLDLWRGVIESRFQLDGQPVTVHTLCHPDLDLVAVRIESPLLADRSLGVAFEFPYGSDQWGPGMADWNSPDRHQTAIVHQTGSSLDLLRTLDRDHYAVRIAASPGGVVQREGPHRFVMTSSGGDTLEFVCAFAPELNENPLPSFARCLTACEEHWRRFWMEGGAIDFSGSRDPRAAELERRVVLSQYLTAIQCAASSPPQESGLTHNSWFGKFHLEMHWWHAAHFALWNRTALLEKSLGWYRDILPAARETARAQGYAGARWPKMTSLDGRESPSGVGVFLIWQQPHPIYYAELCYRAHPDRDTLERYRDVVFATADFMASYARWDEKTNRYVLGPPLIPAQECYPPASTFNPAFELAYWAWGLERAQLWRRRLGLDPDPEWRKVHDALSPLPEKDGLYVTTEATPVVFENADLRRDHPSLVAALGMLPQTGMVDPETMRSTLHAVFRDWNWESTWGWDYPMLAMTAARLDEPGLAVDALLMDTPKNHFLPNGHCYQRPNLPTYLPANGGLLAAVAMMAAGWDGAPSGNAPGFPSDGSWRVHYENLKPMP